MNSDQNEIFHGIAMHYQKHENPMRAVGTDGLKLKQTPLNKLLPHRFFPFIPRSNFPNSPLLTTHSDTEVESHSKSQPDRQLSVWIRRMLKRITLPSSGF